MGRVKIDISLKRKASYPNSHYVHEKMFNIINSINEKQIKTITYCNIPRMAIKAKQKSRCLVTEDKLQYL